MKIWLVVALSGYIGFCIGFFGMGALITRIHTAEELRQFQCGLSLACVTPRG